jgi:2',3'-cyclic-nucleotide 2'-phosphodiesterase (5'-nucleotidase family)
VGKYEKKNQIESLIILIHIGFKNAKSHSVNKNQLIISISSAINKHTHTITNSHNFNKNKRNKILIARYK